MVTLLVLLATYAIVGNYLQARVYDAPLERWVAGDYTAQDPVAFVYADSADALPLPYQLAFPKPVWEIDHDRIIVTLGGRRWQSPRCMVIVREGMHLDSSGRSDTPCRHPDTGEVLDRADQVSYRQILDRAHR